MHSLTNGACQASANSPVTIIKIEKRTHPFAQIDTRALNDARISWKAKGLHAYLLSKPPHWQVRFADLVKHARDRAYSVRSALDELRSARYAVLRPLKNDRGLFCGSCWTIYELPKRSKKPNGDDGFPNLRKTESPRNGVSEKPNPSNNDLSSNNEPVSDNKLRGIGACDSSLANGKGDASIKLSAVFSGPYQNHIKYREFAAYCRSKDGTPTEKGFWTWLAKQKPQRRDRVKEVSEEHGYVLNGRFFKPEEATQHGKDNPDQIVKFRRAIRRNGKVQISEKP
jgi:hypothetical protein